MSAATVWRASALAALVVVPSLVLTGTAQAQDGTVQVISGELTIKAAGRQVNKVLVSHVGDMVVVSDVVPLSAGPGCRKYERTEVRCPATGVTSLAIDLADLDDRAAYKGPMPVYADGGAGDDIVTGGYGGDKLLGGEGVDYVSGGPGNDTLIGGPGADHVYGGTHNDVLYGDLPYATPLCDSGLPSCGDFLYGGDGADKIYGGEWADTLAGEGGNDLLRDFSGGATFRGGPGDDTMIGASPSMRDTVDYSDHLTDVKVDLTAGTGGDVQAGEHDTITSIQDVNGGAGNDSLKGNSGDNNLTGNGGNDSADGGDSVLYNDICNVESPSYC
ncbi:Alkaline phosphatase [Alloactinosynnema sp. L-07]|uniref:calcium-binding protein n=1 Tax=Alloactinosynnema sp. L-07 TaxID=1653480 RepID=UPI00065EFA57|nr:calcium-binding protein [Alloactinosynnema sp. L-07]CRK57363.1 Alkaline phosphatase [Alloactinosynnema sp. L-07]